MTALGVTRFLTQLKDVDPNGLPDKGVPQYDTNVSSFVVVVPATAGAFSMGVTDSGNTLGDTGVTGPRIGLVGTGNLTLSQVTDVNGGTIIISGGTAGGGGGVALSASDTLFSSGTVVLTGAGGGATVNTVAPGTVQISVAAPVPQTVQTQNLFDLTAGGNTAGVLALVSSGTLTLAGGNSITLSQNGNAITISGATTSQSVQTQPIQTGISSIVASNATYTSGSVQFTGSGIVTIRSSANQRVVVDASQSVQTQNLVALTLSGNTSGALALASSGTVTLAGGNNITLSQAGNAITISGANAAGAQTAISGLANSQTTYTSGTVSLSELGAITIRSTTGNQFQFSVNPQSVQPETQTFIGGISASNTLYTSGTVRMTGAGNITIASGTGQQVIISGSQSVQPETQTFLGGISASDALYTSGTVRFTGVGGGVTVSSNTGQRVDISVAAPVAQSVQTQNVVDVTLSGNTAGALALISSGTMTLAGGNNITVSQAGNAVTISGPNVGGAQTGISGIFASDASYTSGTVQFTGSNMVTVKSSAGQRVVIDATQSVQPGVQNIVASDATFSSGTVTISGFGDMTVNTAANLIRISAPVQTAESQSFGMSNIGNTSGTTGIASGAQVRFLLAGGNNVTLSQSINGASGTITISAFSQTVQTQNLHNVTISGNTSGALAAISSGTLTLAGGNNITLSQAGNAVTISGPNTAAQSVESQSIGMSNLGNTSGTTGIASGGQVRFLFAGGNNITLSQSLNGASGTITISAPNLGAGAMSAGVSNLGNSAGATGITGTQLVFVGSDNITLSQTTGANGGTVSIIGGGGGGFSAGASTGGNTAGATGVTGTRMVLVGTNAISLSQTTGVAGATLSIDAPATSSLVGVNGISISTNGSTISVSLNDALADWENFPRGQASLMTHVSAWSKTPIYWNDHIDGGILAKSAAFAISMVTASQPLSLSVHLGVYTFVNSTSVARLGSVSEAYVVSSASSVSLSGVRNIVMTGIGTHATLSSITGGEYLLGMMFSATATNAMNFSLLGASGGAGPLGAIHPGTNALSAGTSQGVQAMAGRGSTTVNAMPANVVASELINQGQGASMQLHPWIYLRS